MASRAGGVAHASAEGSVRGHLRKHAVASASRADASTSSRHDLGLGAGLGRASAAAVGRVEDLAGGAAKRGGALAAAAVGDGDLLASALDVAHARAVVALGLSGLALGGAHALRAVGGRGLHVGGALGLA